MKTIIIAKGIDNNYLATDPPFRDSRQNLGQVEIQRLMGKKGKLGPLPIFIQDALIKANSSQELSVILINDENDGQSGEITKNYPEVFNDISKDAYVIHSKPERTPIEKIHNYIIENYGVDSNIFETTNIMVVGSHTESNLLLIAQGMKNILGYQNVAVCSHLTGSVNPEAHFGSLKHHFQVSGIKVLQTLEEAWSFSGITNELISDFKMHPCEVGPKEAKDELGDEAVNIIELLCMNLTRVSLRPLQGGFSGSLLFIATGQKGNANTEPLVIKIDNYTQMRRELDGYYRVKDFLGKNVPSFGFPVTLGASIGVGMELASMEGAPDTLQDIFEEIDNEEKLNHFMLRLRKSLKIVSDKLYKNTVDRTWQKPYRLFGLHTQEQANWLEQNGNIALSYLNKNDSKANKIDLKRLKKVFRLITANEDGVVGPECLVHGDLNLANIICDQGDNIWFIDWTHCSEQAGALDFSKMENDIKFVMSKDFDMADLSKLKAFEEYLLSCSQLGEIEKLPSKLKFAKWDLRFKRIYEAIKTTRNSYFELEGENNWLLYKIGLLRYAAHTLSFDKKRDRGECEPVQLIYALFSSQTLIHDLAGDDFNLQTRSEKAANYPDRYRLFIDEAPWEVECEHYNPPYYVSEDVLENNYQVVKNGWSDPEEILSLNNPQKFSKTDSTGRPLNPRGRTGIQGRGSLGLWGVNNSIGLVITRKNQKKNEVEIMIEKFFDEKSLAIPKGFLYPEESYNEAVKRVLEFDTGIELSDEELTDISSGHVYDPRQTDHAWVEMKSSLLHIGDKAYEKWLQPKGNKYIEKIKWVSLNADSINQLSSFQAIHVRDALPILEKRGVLTSEEVQHILEATG